MEVSRAGNRVPSVPTSHSTRGRPVHWRPAWPTRPRPRSRGSSPVGRAPAYLYLDSRFLPAQGCYRLPRLDGEGLTGAGFVLRHRRNRVREDTNPAELAMLGPLRCHRQRARDGRALRVIRFLVVPHVDLPHGPPPSLSPHHRVPHRPVLVPETQPPRALAPVGRPPSSPPAPPTLRRRRRRSPRAPLARPPVDTRPENSLKWTMRYPMGMLLPGRDLAWFSLGNNCVVFFNVGVMSPLQPE